MTELVTAAEMHAIERDAIASGEVTGAELMARAGQGVVEAIVRCWPEATSATVLCGPGNNGGDGYVIARLLAQSGWDVRVLGMGDAALMPADARANRLAWEAMGEVAALDEARFRAGPVSDVYIDAIFGTGLTRAPTGDLASLLAHLAGSGGDAAHYTPRLIAVDAPSGLDLDSGRMLAGGAAAPFLATVPLCALTVTFEVPKIGHFLEDGPACCGRLEVVDLGLLAWRSVRRDARTGEVGIEGQPTTPRVHLVDAVPIVASPHPGGHIAPNFRKASGHKYDHGHALIVSGGAGRTGAARLAARAALRVGAGLVTVASPPSALMENAMNLTAIMTRRCKGADGLAEILEGARFTSVCLGPGLGVGDETCAMVRAAIGGLRRVVLDADALTSFEGDAQSLFDMIWADQSGGVTPNVNVVMTPHMGEFRRLFPDIFAQLNPAAAMMDGTLSSGGDFLAQFDSVNKVDAVRAAAKISGAIVLLKGPDTVIATPSGAAFIHSAAYNRCAPWLATAGAGDVLAGLIAGLAAKSSMLQNATAHAAWLHVEAALAFGPGLIAEDLPEMLPQVFRDMGL